MTRSAIRSAIKQLGYLIRGIGRVVAHVVEPRVPRGSNGAAVVVVDVCILHPSVLPW